MYLLTGCSQEKNTLFSRTYHNTTAHYNAYFLARERMKEVDFTLWQSHKDDYTGVIEIYPTLLKEKRQAITSNLEDIIKKAALPVTKHKNSKWVDDSYILLGKARLYQGDFKLASETFKYVNTKGEDINAKHQALVFLMRTYIDSASFDNANTVFDYLAKQKLNNDNLRDFLFVKAYYHARLDEFNKMPGYLEQAIPFIKRKEYKARIHFIIGQIYQLMNAEKEAYKNYTKTLKNNPPYELSFYTKLNLAQVTELSKSNDKKRIQKYFKKLLKDKKNVEYKDKIYYEMGMFEFKQGNVPPAIKYLETSLQQKSTNTFQKSLTYLRMGKIYYENVKNFELAKLYYDSTVAILDPKNKNFKAISERQKVLADFVKQLRIVRLEDSLQKIAKLDSASLNRLIEKVIAQEKEAEKLQEAREKALEERSKGVATTQEDNLDFSGKKWYFYNSTLIAAGKKDFEKKWGKRILEDNWRRSTKDNSNNFNTEPSAADTSNLNASLAKDSIKEAPIDVMANYKKDIPYTQAQVDSSNSRLSKAMYNLGKIYNQKLEEQQNAAVTFETFLTRFPTHDKTPEVMYFLYLIYTEAKDAKADVYRDKLFTEYPNSLYARLIKNPNYLRDSKEANQRAASMYKVAYEMYTSGQYSSADSLISMINSTYPENDIHDKLALLKIIIVGKTKNALVYKDQLQAFVQKNPKSDLVPKANELIVATDRFIEGKTKKGRSIDSLAIQYKTNFNEGHSVGFYVSKSKKQKEILKDINAFNRSEDNYKKLKSSVVNLNDTISVFLVNGMVDKDDAKRYLIFLKNEKNMQADVSDIANSIFVISESNIPLLVKSKYIQGYINFYRENY